MTDSLRVLLVEDSEDDALLLVRELRRSGWSITHERVDSPNAFAEALTRETWDLILCDFTMPHFRGTEALELLRQRNIDIPFIFVSGTIGEDVAVEAMKAGAQDYVMKGNLHRLFPAVARELREAEIRRQKREAEAEVRRSEERLRFIIDSDDNGLVVLDRSGIALFVNRSAAALFGSKASNLTGIQLGLPVTAPSEVPSEMSIPRRDRVLTVEMTAREIEWDRKPAYLVSLHDVSRRKEAEDALREHDRWLKESQRVAQVGSYEFNITTGQWTSSEVLDDILGICREYERTVEGWFKIVYPEDREMMKSYFFEEVLGMRKPFDKDYRVICRTCEEGRWVHGRGELSVDADGKPVKMVGTIHDISERKRAERALRDSEERFRTLFEFAPDAYYLMDTNGVFLAGNAGTERLTGYKREELVGKDFLSVGILAREDVARASRSFEQLLNGEEPDEKGYVIHRKNGASVTIELRTHLINIAGRDTILGIARDVTERQRAEEQIREQAALIDIASDAIVLRDVDGRILYWNKGAEKIYGWTKKEAMGKDGATLFARGDRDIFPQTKETIEKTGTWEGELLQCRKDGRILNVNSRWTLLRDSAGNPASILTVDTDVTERKALEAQFLRAQRLESLGTLAGGIAHDLNNVLGPIILTFDVLKRDFTTERAQKLLSSAEASALRGKSIVSQILTFARGSEGKMGEIQLKHVLKEVLEMAIETFPKNIDIKPEIDRDLWAVNADATGIHQLMMNLLVNARDAMPDGGTLRVQAKNFDIDAQFARLHLHAKVGSYICISVVDTGTGMTQEVLDRMFDPFFTTKQPGKGTGLGLPTVHTIVNKHGGFLDVTSKVNQGSTFQVYLPAIVAGSGGNLNKGDETPRRGRNEIILVVDDEAPVRDVTKQTLEDYGFRVMTANDGVEGVAVYSQHKDSIAAVITDVMMPIMDGVAMVRALHRINPDVPVIATSGMKLESFGASVEAMDFKMFLDKPFTARELLDAVNTVLGMKEA